MSYIPKNYMEICVENLIQEETKNIDWCGCEKCHKDVLAIVLNDLPNEYYGFNGEYDYNIINKIQDKYKNDIIKKIHKAINIVKQSPRHNENDTSINVRNYTEICVESAADRIIEQANYCKCQKCRTDIIVIALNNLKSKYIATRKGELYSKLNALEGQDDINIIAEITKAVAIIKAEHRHE